MSCAQMSMSGLSYPSSFLYDMDRRQQLRDNQQEFIDSPSEFLDALSAAPVFPPLYFDVPDLGLFPSSFSGTPADFGQSDRGYYGSDDIYLRTMVTPSYMDGVQSQDFRHESNLSQTSLHNLRPPACLEHTDLSPLARDAGAISGGLTSPGGSSDTLSSKNPGDDQHSPQPIAVQCAARGVRPRPASSSPTWKETSSPAEDTAAGTATLKKIKQCKKRKKRDPNEPQKPVSAYALFFRDSQAAIKGHNPSASFGEVSKIVASLWDQLEPAHKDMYKKKTEVSKKQYLKQLAAYRATQVSQAGSDQDHRTAQDSKTLQDTRTTHLSGEGTEETVLSPGCFKKPGLADCSGNFEAAGPAVNPTMSHFLSPHLRPGEHKLVQQHSGQPLHTQQHPRLPLHTQQHPGLPLHTKQHSGAPFHTQQHPQGHQPHHQHPQTFHHHQTQQQMCQQHVPSLPTMPMSQLHTRSSQQISVSQHQISNLQQIPMGQHRTTSSQEMSMGQQMTLLPHHQPVRSTQLSPQLQSPASCQNYAESSHRQHEPDPSLYPGMGGVPFRVHDHQMSVHPFYQSYESGYRSQSHGDCSWGREYSSGSPEFSVTNTESASGDILTAQARDKHSGRTVARISPKDFPST